MKKVVKVMVAAFMMVLCMTGCGEDQDEFVDYVNNSRPEIIQLEKKAKDSYSAYSDSVAEDVQAALEGLKTETVDLTKQAVDKATEVEQKLEGEQLKKVHGMYVSALKDFQSGLDQMIQALENEDSDQVTQANEAINKASDEITKYIEEVTKLADELGVELKAKE